MLFFCAFDCKVYAWEPYGRPAAQMPGGNWEDTVLPPEWSLEWLPLKFQDDGHSCGVWVHYASCVFVQYCRQHPRASSTGHGATRLSSQRVCATPDSRSFGTFLQRTARNPHETGFANVCHVVEWDRYTAFAPIQDPDLDGNAHKCSKFIGAWKAAMSALSEATAADRHEQDLLAVMKRLPGVSRTFAESVLQECRDAPLETTLVSLEQSEKDFLHMAMNHADRLPLATQPDEQRALLVSLFRANDADADLALAMAITLMDSRHQPSSPQCAPAISSE